MQPNELYLLSPLAWTHAQEVLAREADMIGQGISKKKRAAFLERECQRLMEVASISIPESIDAVLADLSSTDIVEGYEAMRERFRRHGFEGTTRTLRNISRRLDCDEVGLDMGTISAGCHILADDEHFATVARRVFGPLVDTFIEHPAYASGEIAFEQLAQQQLLPSEKDKRSQALAKEAVKTMLEGMTEVDFGNVRDIAYLRGRLLDVDLADIMCTIMSTGGTTTIAEVMRASAASQLNQYCDVLETALTQRIYELASGKGNGVDPSPSNPTMDTAILRVNPDPHMEATTSQSPLLSIPEVMLMLGVSRSTINRMLDDGVLEKIKVRNRTMVTRKSLDLYVALS
ncbi:MAG: helix-turn-helix domain-containing protein [bacterium]|nr:helix-turn-helix domain-containing protein [bacterium]